MSGKVMAPGDVSRPRVICEACGAVRYCDLHTKAEFPPDAALKWLKRNCRARGCVGGWFYQAGLRGIRAK